MINNRANVLLNFVIYSISSVHQEENYIFEYFSSIHIFAFTWLSVSNIIINSAELPKAVIMICNLLELEKFSKAGPDMIVQIVSSPHICSFSCDREKKVSTRGKNEIMQSKS